MTVNDYGTKQLPENFETFPITQLMWVSCNHFNASDSRRKNCQSPLIPSQVDSVSRMKMQQNTQSKCKEYMIIWPIVHFFMQFLLLSYIYIFARNEYGQGGTIQHWFYHACYNFEMSLLLYCEMW